ncbi:MAG: hypothetical protein RI566_02640 [Sediminimonas sp.]|uniref:hypothetical protein n=1 Tax=Sediminimonas sp. TaxID=2823379 RepID=UPI0028709A2E|nr:hypothetical protein [Sediminimonas sp.]MDR9484048.1 hypothetical protein [Sediminimonas sp.]
MSQATTCIVACLAYGAEPELSFPEIVSAFGDVLDAHSMQQRSISFDADDIALIDLDMMRIALGWYRPETADQSWYLAIAVGPSPHSHRPTIPRRFSERLAQSVIDRINTDLPFDAVLWSDTTPPLDVDKMDQILDALGGVASMPSDPRSSGAQEIRSVMAGAKESARMAGGSPEDYIHVGEVQDTTPHHDAEEPGDDKKTARRLFAEVYVEEPEGCSLQMYLTVYTLGTTLLLMTPPVGAAMLAYTVLRDLQSEAPKPLRFWKKAA